MRDDCQHCTLRGNMEECIKEPCSVRNETSWYHRQIHEQLEDSRRAHAASDRSHDEAYENWELWNKQCVKAEKRLAKIEKIIKRFMKWYLPKTTPECSCEYCKLYYTFYSWMEGK